MSETLAGAARQQRDGVPAEGRQDAPSGEVREDVPSGEVREGAPSGEVREDGSPEQDGAPVRDGVSAEGQDSTTVEAPQAPQGRLAAVRIRGLRRTFGARDVLDGLDLDIAQGEFVALLGASGTGKTTLLRILGALDRHDAGTVLVPEARTIVFQEPRLVPSKKVLANVTVALPRGPRTKETGRRALAEVGLDGHADAWPATLSGGEAQRVALARALIREPELLLLDEPFAALDALTRLRMHDLVGELCRRHRPAVLLVTHDVDEAIRLADRVAVLRDGRLAVDERIAIDHPRDSADPRFAALRTRLLDELGVHRADPAPDPAASKESPA